MRENPAPTAVNNFLLGMAILATLITFWKRSQVAGGLLTPRSIVNAMRVGYEPELHHTVK